MDSANLHVEKQQEATREAGTLKIAIEKRRETWRETLRRKF